MITHPSVILRKIYPSLNWRISTENYSAGVYLTFDDGPTPGVTNQVLKLLKKFNAKATFFCVGKNVIRYPRLYQRIIEEGHQVGNHGYNHLNGWKTSSKEYIQDVLRCSKSVDSNLFRPPYGKISNRQIRMLKRNFHIIMWSVLSMDYSVKISKEKSLSITLKKLKNGDIITMHDSVKAKDNMLFVLEHLLEHLELRKWESRKIIVKGKQN